MNIYKKLYSVDVIPLLGQHENVVAKVLWGIDFEEQNLISRHAAQTLLRVDEIADFIPINQLTKEQVIDWCISTEGGQPYMQQLVQYHSQQLQSQIAEMGFVRYSEFPVDPLPMRAGDLTVPTSVL